MNNAKHISQRIYIFVLISEYICIERLVVNCFLNDDSADDAEDDDNYDDDDCDHDNDDDDDDYATTNHFPNFN